MISAVCWVSSSSSRSCVACCCHRDSCSSWRNSCSCSCMTARCPVISLFCDNNCCRRMSTCSTVSSKRFTLTRRLLTTASVKSGALMRCKQSLSSSALPSNRLQEGASRSAPIEFRRDRRGACASFFSDFVAGVEGCFPLTAGDEMEVLEADVRRNRLRFSYCRRMRSPSFCLSSNSCFICSSSAALSLSCFSSWRFFEASMWIFACRVLSICSRSSLIFPKTSAVCCVLDISSSRMPFRSI
mmetsp:Transcript_21761/g.34526  ORF Transcript_21761/g.34526 Transcript_21761/m.34526 type:complete len:242 (-) Transcript_21761:1297-2022(-)